MCRRLGFCLSQLGYASSLTGRDFIHNGIIFVIKRVGLVTLRPIRKEIVGVMNIAMNTHDSTEYRSDDSVTISWSEYRLGLDR
jgi:hypothetical protein